MILNKRSKLYSPKNLVRILHVSSSSILLSSKSAVFEGLCLDIGAQQSVCGYEQAMAYCKKNNRQLKLQESPRRFQFGDGIHKSMGTFIVRLPTPDGSYIRFEMDVIKINIPMLLGLDLLDQHSLVADNVDNLLVSKTIGWSIPITRKLGHLYVEWDPSTPLNAYYTKAELLRMHLHFYHPSVSKLFNLIKRAKPEHANAETKGILQEITDACQVFQRFTPRPLSFKVSLPDKIILNQELALDLMYIDKKPLLHIVDTQTHFGNAAFLPDPSSETVWKTFQQLWSTVYIGCLLYTSPSPRDA